tara:strand:+ start:317 stop:901 length:585 start_codon:yes stop_codon:yes gene_type:complete
MLFNKTFLFSVLIFVFSLNQNLFSDLIIDSNFGLELDITETIGSGQYSSYVVIDFEATGGNSWAFEYKFNDDGLVVHDMLMDFESVGLSYAYTDWGAWGVFVDNFSYGENNIGEVSNYWAHSLGFSDGSGSVEWSAADGGVESVALVDGLISGWFNGFNPDYSVINPSLPLIPAPGALFFISLSVFGHQCRRQP